VFSEPNMDFDGACEYGSMVRSEEVNETFVSFLLDHMSDDSRA
jgi:hypothetical protein